MRTDRSIGISSLIVLAAIRRLGDEANGLAVAEQLGVKAEAVYNLLGRLIDRELVSAERDGLFKIYTLTKRGEKFLDETIKAIA